MTRSNAYLYGVGLARAGWSYTMILNALQDPTLFEDCFEGFCDARDRIMAKRTILIQKYQTQGWGK